MKHLSRIFCKKLREARREAGLKQSDVAVEVGCNQSALSMFEQGDGTKLNDDVIAKLAKKFNLEITTDENEASGERTNDIVVPLQTAQPATGFCPNPHCPSNHAYRVEERIYYRPDRTAADPVGGRFCAVCGELLERCCSRCGAPVHDGAICSLCGDPYVVSGFEV